MIRGMHLQPEGLCSCREGNLIQARLNIMPHHYALKYAHARQGTLLAWACLGQQPCMTAQLVLFSLAERNTSLLAQCQD